MNWYDLSRAWFEYSFNNPEKINPWHSAVYFFAIEHCNRLWWKEKFWFPSQMVMEAVWIRNWRTYSKYLQDLVEWGFIEMIEKSKNQYSSNIIAIVKNTKATTKALDKALSKHSTKHSQSTASIYKQVTTNKKQETIVVATKVAHPKNLESYIKEKIDIKYFTVEYQSNQDYIIKQLQEFYLYWSEKKPNWKKERWEMQKTFDVTRRFHKWLANNSKWNKEDVETESKDMTQEQKEQKLRDLWIL